MDAPDSADDDDPNKPPSVSSGDPLAG